MNGVTGTESSKTTRQGSYAYVGSHGDGKGGSGEIIGFVTFLNQVGDVGINLGSDCVNPVGGILVDIQVIQGQRGTGSHRQGGHQYGLGIDDGIGCIRDHGVQPYFNGGIDVRKSSIYNGYFGADGLTGQRVGGNDQAVRLNLKIRNGHAKSVSGLVIGGIRVRSCGNGGADCPVAHPVAGQRIRHRKGFGSSKSIGVAHDQALRNDVHLSKGSNRLPTGSQNLGNHGNIFPRGIISSIGGNGDRVRKVLPYPDGRTARNGRRGILRIERCRACKKTNCNQQ